MGKCDSKNRGLTLVGLHPHRSRYSDIVPEHNPLTKVATESGAPS